MNKWRKRGRKGVSPLSPCPTESTFKSREIGTSREKRKLFLCPLLTCPLALQCRPQGTENIFGGRTGEGSEKCLKPCILQDAKGECRGSMLIGTWGSSDAESSWRPFQPTCLHAAKDQLSSRKWITPFAQTPTGIGICHGTHEEVARGGLGRVWSRAWKARSQRLQRHCSSCYIVVSPLLCVCFLLLSLHTHAQGPRMAARESHRRVSQFQGGESDGTSWGDVSTSLLISCRVGSYCLGVAAGRVQRTGYMGESPERIFAISTLVNRWSTPD